MARVLLTVIGTAGTVEPFVAIATALRQRGHDPVVFTNAPHVRRFQRSLECMVALDSEEQFKEFLEDSSLLNDARNLRKVFTDHFLPNTIREYRLMSEHMRGGETAIVANEAPGIAARLLAESYRVPLVSIFTYPSHVSGMSLLDELIINELAIPINDFRRHLGLSHEIDLRLWWKSAKNYLGLWPDWFYLPAKKSVTAYDSTGFVWVEDSLARAADEDFPKDALAHDPVVLVTGGTGMFAGPSFFRSVTQALRATRVPALVIAQQKEMFDAAQPENGILGIVKNVPSIDALLERVSLVIHHGGMGIIAHSVSKGVPQLILADGGDRPYNGSLVERAGLGLYLPRERWLESEISRAIQTLLTDSSFKTRCDYMANRTKITDSLERAASAIEHQLTRNVAARSCYATPLRSTVKGIDNGLMEAWRQLSLEKRAAVLQLLHKRSLGR